MFNLFKKKSKPALPPFEALAGYVDKDKYFVRVASWTMSDDNYAMVVDPNQPRVITMDPWPQLVFIDATGNRTIKEYIEHMAGKYDGEVPAELDETIIHQIDELLKLKIIALSNEPQVLKPEHDKPRSSNKR